MAKEFNKNDLRKQTLNERNALDVDERLSMSHEIMDKVVSHYDFLHASEILIFVNWGSEVDTKGIILYSLMLGKKVYCPMIYSLDLNERMDFFEINSLDELTEGYQGILEPSFISNKKWSPSAQKALMILPGVVFDKSGNRIGYGKGFYDRFLRENKFNGIKMAPTFSFQVKDVIPSEEFDEKVDLIITESEIILCEV